MTRLVKTFQIILNPQTFELYSYDDLASKKQTFLINLF